MQAELLPTAEPHLYSVTYDGKDQREQHDERAIAPSLTSQGPVRPTSVIAFTLILTRA